MSEKKIYQQLKMPRCSLKAQTTMPVNCCVLRVIIQKVLSVAISVADPEGKQHKMRLLTEHYISADGTKLHQ